jgi:5-methylcytosine-specific restriction protein A
MFWVLIKAVQLVFLTLPQPTTRISMPSIPKSRPKTIQPKQKNQHQGRQYYNPNYNTHRWRLLRLELLKMNPICVSCNKALASEADHIEPVRVGGDFWNPDNIQMLCKSCHSSKSAKERHEKNKNHE